MIHLYGIHVCHTGVSYTWVMIHLYKIHLYGVHVCHTGVSYTWVNDTPVYDTPVYDTPVWCTCMPYRCIIYMSNDTPVYDTPVWCTCMPYRCIIYMSNDTPVYDIPVWCTCMLHTYHSVNTTLWLRKKQQGKSKRGSGCWHMKLLAVAVNWASHPADIIRDAVLEDCHHPGRHSTAWGQNLLALFPRPSCLGLERCVSSILWNCDSGSVLSKLIFYATLYC